MEHGILSKAEVRALVKKRTDFEYRLRRRAAERRDFERYIEYEMTFERLLKSRRERLGIVKGKGTGKFSCVKHIHFIFDRAVKKFRGDIDLWLEWIAYAKMEMSSKVLSKVFARALQLHPRNAKLWVHAAAYEWDMGNVTASRTLLQRGIRLNSKAADLWREYFRMEVLFTARLAERRRVLGLSKMTTKVMSAVGGGEAAIAIDDLDEEAKNKEGNVALPDAHSTDAGLEELLAGSIPKAVVRYARETMGSNPEIFFSMYDICHLASDTARSNLEEEILAVIDDIASCPPTLASSIATSEAAAAAAVEATAAALTGSATRRAARAMAESIAAGGAEKTACDAAQKVLDKYLEPYRDVAGAVSPRSRKSAKGNKGASARSSTEETAPRTAVAHSGTLATAMWQAVCGFWTELEAQAKGKAGAGSKGAGSKGAGGAAAAVAAGHNAVLAKEAGLRASELLRAARQQGVWTEDIALESIRHTLKRAARSTGGADKEEGGKEEAGKKSKASKRARGEGVESAVNANAEAVAIAKAALAALPANVHVAAEYLRLLAKAVMAEAAGEERGGKGLKALDELAGCMDSVLATCGGARGAHRLWTDRVQLLLARGADVEQLVGVLLRATEACSPAEAVQVAIAALAAAEEAHGREMKLAAGMALLQRPLPSQVKGAVLEALAEGEIRRAEEEEEGGSSLGARADLTTARNLLSMWAGEERAKVEADLWLRWERAERAAGEHKRASGVHWRALRTLDEGAKDEYHRRRIHI